MFFDYFLNPQNYQNGRRTDNFKYYYEYIFNINYEYEFIMEVRKMPGMDGTGPFGQGPMTGRGLGYCGRGLRRGFGRGFGRAGYVYPLTLTKEEQKKILEAQLKEIELEKQNIEKKLEELK